MVKSSSSSLTGGSGDVNPQFLTGTAAQTVADTTLSTQFQLPIDRMSQKSGKSQVLEVLKVFVNMGTTIVETDNVINFVLSTSNFGATDITTGEPRAFLFHSRIYDITTSGSTLVTQPTVYDFTDGAGHGLIIATDSIFAQVQSAGTSVANSIGFKILYRWKNIGLQEYIGVVQSQN